MSGLVFQNRNGIDKLDSRTLAKTLGIKQHKQWLADTIIANEELIINATGIELEIDFSPNTRGAKTKFAWFTEDQAYFVITLTRNTENGMKAKAQIARMLTLARKQQRKSANAMQWTERLEKIFAYKESLFVTFEKIDRHFSPDKHFAQFLLQLETETGYSTPWNLEESTPFVCPHGYEQYVKKYVDITMGAHENDNGWLIDMWGVDQPPDFNDEALYSPDAVQSYGVVWVDEPDNCKELWLAFMEQLKNLIEVYEDPNRKAKYGIPSLEEVAGGYDAGYVDWEINSEPLEAILEASQAFDNAYHVDVKITGFQAHKDWLEWLKSDDEMARAMRKFHLGSSKPVEFKTWVETDEDDYKLLQTTPGTLITRHRSWGDPIDFDNLNEEEEEAKRPLCTDARLYEKKYLPLFDWYLNNIWLPQHAVKFFQTIDPTGYPKLCEAMKALPPNSTLPMQFVEAMNVSLAQG